MPIRGSPNGARHPRPQVSRSPEIGGRDPSERLVVINWNDWSRSIGIAGRHQPVRAGSLALRSFLPLPCSTRITMRSESMSDTRGVTSSNIAAVTSTW